MRGIELYEIGHEFDIRTSDGYDGISDTDKFGYVDTWDVRSDRPV